MGEGKRGTQVIKLASRENVFILPVCLVAPVSVLAELVSTGYGTMGTRFYLENALRCCSNCRDLRL